MPSVANKKNKSEKDRREMKGERKKWKRKGKGSCRKGRGGEMGGRKGEHGESWGKSERSEKDIQGGMWKAEVEEGSEKEGRKEMWKI